MKLLAKIRSYIRSWMRRSRRSSPTSKPSSARISNSAPPTFERTGLTSAEAHRRACIEFGTVEIAHGSDLAPSRRLRALRRTRADLRFACSVAALRRSHPGFTAIAIISLGLGIGANTIIFTMAKAILLDRLRRPQPQ